MHKITKGLKKKKKGKKSKHKEDELFKPEELEAYRKEHRQQAVAEAESVASGAAESNNDEWNKFNALAAGIDTFLKKTQDDLDRIKSTSFFQRIPPSSETHKQDETVSQPDGSGSDQVPWRQEEESPTVVTPVETGIVQLSETESEQDDQDDIFDTAYVDVLEAAQVKLAYVPESPTDEPDTDDPFDTSIAERAILGPETTRKGKKLVPLGSAVEVLTGRVRTPATATIKRPSARRTQFRTNEQTLLLTSFQNAAPAEFSRRPSDAEPQPPEPPPLQSLLDNQPPDSLLELPVDLIASPAVQSLSAAPLGQNESRHPCDVGIEERQSPEDDEFSQLAAESLSKTCVATILKTSKEHSDVPEANWQAEFRVTEHSKHANGEEDTTYSEQVDPFDTTFAENIIPGKCELKIIENEILFGEIDKIVKLPDKNKLTDLVEKLTNIQSNIATNDCISSEGELVHLKPAHRDLLGGSVTDLSGLSEEPLKPDDNSVANYIEYCDPFDTTTIEISTIPGQVELKFLEKELLSDFVASSKPLNDLNDDSFDPRSEEYVTRNEQSQDRKQSVGSLTGKSVAFLLPIPITENDSVEDVKKSCKPLTPYYVRENSIPEQPLDEEDAEEIDPFDTSFVADVKPGKAELRVLEAELFQPDLKHSISDPDFDPRDEKQINVAKVVQTIREIENKERSSEETHRSQHPVQIDLLNIDNSAVIDKVLTPANETTSQVPKYVDPFDTSIAFNILPGKTELKLLENELIRSDVPINRILIDPDFDPRHSATIVQKQPTQPNLLEDSVEQVPIKPLTPISGSKIVKFIGQDADCDQDCEENIDPFDTSIANNLGLGQTEIKLLESELI